jgi:hypothetical protein
LDRSVAEALLAAVRHEPEPDFARVPPGELLAEAERRGVIGLVARRLGDRGGELDEASREAVLARLARERRHRAIHQVEIERAVTALSGVGTPTVVLKGPPLALEIYEDPVDREFRDIDVLVPRDRVDAAMEALSALGYGIAVTPRVARVYRRHHFHWLLGGPGKPMLELHWDLARPDDPFHLDPERVLEQARASTPELGQLLHAVIDLAVGGATDLKRLIDLDRLLRSDLDVPPSELAERAEALGMGPAVRLACELAGELLGAPAEPWIRPLSRHGIDDLLPISRANMLRGSQTDAEPLSAAWLRYALSPAGSGRLGRLLLRSRFDRARLAAEGVGPLRRVAADLKRLLRLGALRARLAVHGAESGVKHSSSSSS